MHRDRFQLSHTGNIYINYRSLIDIVKEIEMSYAQIEYDARIEEENPQDLSLIAGDYMPLPLWITGLPSKHLLGKPLGIAEKGFKLEEDNPIKNKTTVLGCSCGVIECWFLLAKITLTDTTVTWSNFQNFHQDGWEYNLNFTFDSQEYEAGLVVDLSTTK